MRVSHVVSDCGLRNGRYGVTTSSRLRSGRDVRQRSNACAEWWGINLLMRHCNRNELWGIQFHQILHSDLVCMADKNLKPDITHPD